MKVKLVLLVLITVVFYSFTMITSDVKKGKIDKELIGSWSGFEKDNQTKGVTKYWVQHRFKDGTFVMLFTAIENCEVTHLTNSGTWWVKDGLFYEKFNADDKIDVYKYEFLESNVLQFTSKELSLEFENKEYQFTEKKLVDGQTP